MVTPPLERMQTQTVYATALVRLGRLETKPDDPLFSAALSPGHYLAAFPETELEITYERAGHFVVDPTAVTFYNADDFYVRRAISTEGDRCNWISTEPELLAELLFGLGLSESASTPRFSAPVARCTSEAFIKQRSLFEEIGARTLDPLNLEERAIGLIRSLLSTQAQNAPERLTRLSPATLRSVAKAQEFLASRFRESCSVQEIARSASCSPFHLCRAFRAHTGLSLHAYRTALRLHHGYDELPHCANLTDLALDLGFASHSHFSQKFKDHFGRTPRSIARARGSH